MLEYFYSPKHKFSWTISNLRRDICFLLSIIHHHLYNAEIPWVLNHFKKIRGRGDGNDHWPTCGRGRSLVVTYWPSPGSSVTWFMWGYPIRQLHIRVNYKWNHPQMVLIQWNTIIYPDIWFAKCYINSLGVYSFEVDVFLLCQTQQNIKLLVVIDQHEPIWDKKRKHSVFQTVEFWLFHRAMSEFPAVDLKWVLNADFDQLEHFRLSNTFHHVWRNPPWLFLICFITALSKGKKHMMKVEGRSNTPVLNCFHWTPFGPIPVDQPDCLRSC